MEILALIRDGLTVGGDVALIVVAIALWKFDRRLLTVELHVKQLMRKES